MPSSASALDVPGKSRSRGSGADEGVRPTYSQRAGLSNVMEAYPMQLVKTVDARSIRLAQTSPEIQTFVTCALCTIFGIL